MFEGLLSPTHLIIILVIALIVLGPKRLPEAGRGLGQAIRGFRESISGSDSDEDEDRMRAPEAPAPRPVLDGRAGSEPVGHGAGRGAARASAGDAPAHGPPVSGAQPPGGTT